MLYREIMAVRSQINTKHINTLCRQNVDFLNVKLVVQIVTTGLCNVKLSRVLIGLQDYEVKGDNWAEIVAVVGRVRCDRK